MRRRRRIKRLRGMSTSSSSLLLLTKKMMTKMQQKQQKRMNLPILDLSRSIKLNIKYLSLFLKYILVKLSTCMPKRSIWVHINNNNKKISRSCSYAFFLSSKNLKTVFIMFSGYLCDYIGEKGNTRNIIISALRD